MGKIYRLSKEPPVSFLCETMVFFSWNSQMVSERNEFDAENWREIAKIKAETGHDKRMNE